MGSAERRRAAQKDLERAGGRDMPVEVVAYDPSWPASFEAERRRVAHLLDGAEIHHIGSTAVPGLAAKPIVDMIAVVQSYEAPVARLVKEAGYRYPEAFNATLLNRRFLIYPTPARRTHHMHLLEDPSELERYLLFRDRLRADAALARDYVALKRSLAERYSDDRESYTQAKSGFILAHCS
jgi:GrpB-like predicted nucleotidyltransferase (UPF0157 family)